MARYKSSAAFGALLLALGAVSGIAEAQDLPLEDQQRADRAKLIARLVAEKKITREQAALLSVDAPRETILSTKPVKSTRAQIATQEASAKGGPRAQADAPSQFQFFLRQNFTDVQLFHNPTETMSAKGAAFTWSDDRVAHDMKWTVHGMAALTYNVSGDYAPDNQSAALLGLVVASYVQVDRETHSNQQNKNIDTITGGFAGEIGFDTWGGQQYFRGRIAAITDNIKDQTSVNGTVEWIPVFMDACIGFPCSVPGIPNLIYRFQPELMVQFDSIAGRKVQPLAFSDRDQALRIGPQFTLILKPFGLAVPDLLKRITANLTYHWAEEAYSGRSFNWLDASLTYNVDAAGHIGLKAGYQRGATEETGQTTNLFTLALTGKI